MRRSLARAGVEFDTLTSRFPNATCEAVLARLRSNTAADSQSYATGKPHTPRPMHCNASSSASSSYHTLFIQRQEQATGQATLASPGALLKTAASRASLLGLLWPLLFPSFRLPFIVFILFRHFHQFPSHPFCRGPAPRQRYSFWPTASLLLRPTSPDGTRSSSAVAVSTVSLAPPLPLADRIVWRVSFLFRAHRGGVESRQSLSVFASKDMLSIELPEESRKKERQ